MLSPSKLKRKKILDIIISIFLISTLGLAAFIVSCSDQNNIISSYNTDQGSPYHQHVHGKRGLVTSAVTATFEAVGSGAAQEVGEVGMGWALGAIGLTGASGPNWQAEFNTINSDLNTIINLLNESNEELASINAVLNEINCSQQSGSLQNAITAIEDDYAKYNTIIGTFTYQQDTAQFLSISAFLNQVFNGANGVMTLSSALSEIQANMTFPSGNVLTACMGTIPVPANGTFRGDSVYYAAAQSVLNYYYYYQTIGLGLLSEAYHYQGWLAAGAPGAGTKYSADSIQNICNDKNAEYDCAYVVNATNSQYNTLLIEFNTVGAPYTGEDLIYQKNTNGDQRVWVRSLEDYTSQSGANCNYPLNVNNLCGPASGKAGSTLSYTTYYGTQNFTVPGYYELNGLVYPTPTTNGTIGNFLDSIGFENMNVNPPKVLIADSLIKLVSTGNDFTYYIDTMTVIPYISPGYPVFTQINYYGTSTKRAIYSELYDFIGYNSTKATDVSMHYTGYFIISSSPCANYSGTQRGIQTSWFTSGAALPWGGPNGNAGYIQFCQDEDSYNVHDIAPFTWNSTSSSPGWSYYSRNSNPQNAFFIPVRTNFTGSEGCITSSGSGLVYNNVNSSGFIRMCGEDFQNYMNLNLPAPPTCNSTNFPYANPMCTILP